MIDALTDYAHEVESDVKTQRHQKERKKKGTERVGGGRELIGGCFHIYCCCAAATKRTPVARRQTTHLRGSMLIGHAVIPPEKSIIVIYSTRALN